jgi:sRNA-binding protein
MTTLMASGSPARGPEFDDTTTIPADDKKPNFRKRLVIARHELLLELQERFPAAFPVDPEQIRPLELGVHQKLRAVLGDDRWFILGRFMGWHAHRWHYLRALTIHRERIGLDGLVAGEITDEDQEAARVEMQAIEARCRVSRKAAKVAAIAKGRAMAKQVRQQERAAAVPAPPPPLPVVEPKSPAELGLRPTLRLKRKDSNLRTEA